MVNRTKRCRYLPARAVGQGLSGQQCWEGGFPFPGLETCSCQLPVFSAYQIAHTLHTPPLRSCTASPIIHVVPEAPDSETQPILWPWAILGWQEKCSLPTPPQAFFAPSLVWSGLHCLPNSLRPQGQLSGATEVNRAPRPGHSPCRVPTSREETVLQPAMATKPNTATFQATQASQEEFSSIGKQVPFRCNKEGCPPQGLPLRSHNQTRPTKPWHICREEQAFFGLLAILG